MSEPQPIMIAVRGYSEAVPYDTSKSNKGEKAPKRRALPRPSDEVVVFDTETTTDHTQNLRLGSYQVRIAGELHERGLFYEPDNLTAPEQRLVKSYAQKRGLTVRTRENFVREILYLHGYDHGGLILGFNLPFDLSRLATAICTSHSHDMRGGFSLTLLPEKWRPNILIKHLNSATSFMRFAADMGAPDARSVRKKGIDRTQKGGYFQDLKTLSNTLIGHSSTLGQLAGFLKTEHQKLDTDEHGRQLTARYLDYSVNDTDVTWECYVELLKRYDAHRLEATPPHRIYSEASLGKAYLRQMGIRPWKEVQRDFSSKTIGIFMSSYYGGRAEVRIRRQVVRVLYCDFRSMYPTVCTLMRLWPFVIATGIEQADCTEEIRRLLQRLTLVELKRPSFWRGLNVLVQIKPDKDVLPVRARYPVRNRGGEGSRTIGLNVLSAKFGLWYTLADCIASMLATGKVPEVLRAIRFTPKGSQTGLADIAIGGDPNFTIHPSKDDFFKRVIEMRGEVQAEEKSAKAAGDMPKAEQLASQSQMLKLLANSTSYGIYAEMNVQSYDHLRDARCYGSEPFSFALQSKSIEEPGTNFHPLLATLITGAARLMLSIAERVAADNGLGWAFCDTDSLALARPGGMGDSEFLARAQKVTHWFDSLNPYADDRPLFKIEEQNFKIHRGKVDTDTHEPLYAIAISAKRYVLFNIGKNGKPVIRKGLAHGLGHLMEPYKETKAPKSIPAPVFDLSECHLHRWHYDLWYRIVVATLEGHPDQVDLSGIPGLYRPARSRYSAATSATLHWFDKFNEGKPFSQQVKAFNFLLAYQVSKPAFFRALALGIVEDDEFDGLPAVVAPFDTDHTKAASRAFDRHTGQPAPAAILATYREAVAAYHLHAEAKFLNGEDTQTGITGRRHVQAVALEYIGKEANRLEEQFYLGEVPEAQIEYGMSPADHSRVFKLIKGAEKKFGASAVANAAEISRQQLSEILKRKAAPRSRTLQSLTRAIGALAEQQRQAKIKRAEMMDRLRGMIRTKGLAMAARDLGQHPSNIKKVLLGARKISAGIVREIGLREMG